MSGPSPDQQARAAIAGGIMLAIAFLGLMRLGGWL